VTALARIASAGMRKDSKLTAPFVGPQSILNNRITGQRRFATQHYQIDRLKAICGGYGCIAE